VVLGSASPKGARRDASAGAEQLLTSTHPMMPLHASLRDVPDAWALYGREARRWRTGFKRHPTATSLNGAAFVAGDWPDARVICEHRRAHQPPGLHRGNAGVWRRSLGQGHGGRPHADFVVRHSERPRRPGGLRKYHQAPQGRLQPPSVVDAGMRFCALPGLAH